MKNYYDILEAQEATSYDSSISNISEDEAANHIDLFDANMDYSSQLVYANLGEQQLNYECLNFQLEMDGEENNDVSKNFNQLPNECLDYEEQDHAKNSGFDDLPSDSFDLDSIQKTPTSPSVSNMDFEVELSGEESLNMSIDSEEALDHSPHHFNNSSEAKSDREEKFNEILGCFGFKNNFKFEKESSTKKVKFLIGPSNNLYSQPLLIKNKSASIQNKRRTLKNLNLQKSKFYY